MGKWAIITGAGTGIGAGLAKHLANKGINVLAVGRRLEPLQQVKEDFPEKIYPLSADIATDEGIDKIVQSIPTEDTLVYLVQNAAIGVPGRLGEIKREDFEYAIAVNVTAPLMMTQRLLPRLKLAKGQGRILHIGTNIAFTAQTGTATYGITKMAFHRLYQQLKVDLVGTGKNRLFRETTHTQFANVLFIFIIFISKGVNIGSVHPGVVDTEGLWEHAKLAKAADLPHAVYFDQLKKEGSMLTPEYVAKFLSFLLEKTNAEEFSEKEWHIKDESHWSRWQDD